MSLSSAGLLTIADDFIIKDGGTIGSASDVDAITIASNGQVTLTQTLIGTDLDISGDVDVDGTLEADAITIGGTAVGSIFSPIAGGTGIVTTGALDAGSITSGFGAINNGASNITTTGVGTFASLDISGNIDVDGTANLDAVDIDGAVDMASTLLVTGVATLTAKPIADAGASVKNGATSAGFIEFFEDSNNGTNKVTLIGPASTADITLTLPATAGTIATTVSAADEATALAIALG
jgi:cytoskeletal protein CcmA (bactofilin family)